MLLVQGLYDPASVETVQECRLCDERIYRYCHSAAGTLRAFAWTTIGPDSEDDPRYGTHCQYGGTLSAFRHEPEALEYREGE